MFYSIKKPNITKIRKQKELNQYNHKFDSTQFTSVYHTNDPKLMQKLGVKHLGIIS